MCMTKGTEANSSASEEPAASTQLLTGGRPSGVLAAGTQQDSSCSGAGLPDT